ncbi:hypothetical protein AB0K00_20665 [Dactylosporangium sp. NPDC049525]|uniref:hypothetical protein n=1 Tax=Dactylosporangium sp. NPDC049525 TaxID=3154730 RepID=UPI003425EB19
MSTDSGSVSGSNVVNDYQTVMDELVRGHVPTDHALEQLRAALRGILLDRHGAHLFRHLTSAGRDIGALLLYAEPDWFGGVKTWVPALVESLLSGDQRVYELAKAALRRVRPGPDTNMARWSFELRALLRHLDAEMPPGFTIPFQRSHKLPGQRRWTTHQEGMHAGWTTSEPQSTPENPPTATVNIDAYLDTHDMQVAVRVVEALDRLSTALGYDELNHGSLKEGSFRWRTRAATRRARDELASRLIKVERMLELQHLDGRQADVDTKEAQAVAQLMEALKDVPRACMRVGSILIVKYVDAGAPVILVRNLSQPEIRLLEQYPEIQQNPANVLTALATAAASSVQDPVRP